MNLWLPSLIVLIASFGQAVPLRSGIGSDVGESEKMVRGEHLTLHDLLLGEEKITWHKSLTIN